MLRFASSAKRFANQRQAEGGDASEEAKQISSGDWRRLWELASRDRSLLAVSSLSLVVAALCDVAVPSFSAAALSAVVSSDSAAFSRALRGLVIFSLGSAVFTGLRGGFFSIAGSRVVARLRFKLMCNLLRQEISFFDKHDTGELTSRLGSDAAKLSNVVSYHVNIIARQSIQAAGGLAYLFFLNGKMAAASVGGLLLMSGVSWLNGAFGRWLSREVRHQGPAARRMHMSLGLVSRCQYAPPSVFDRFEVPPICEKRLPTRRRDSMESPSRL